MSSSMPEIAEELYFLRATLKEVSENTKMYSPSDDGQCTDSDKEDRCSRKEGSLSSNASQTNLVYNDDDKEMAKRMSCDDATPSLMSDQEDEEIRLRLKLLEKRGGTAGSLVAEIDRDDAKQGSSHVDVNVIETKSAVAQDKKAHSNIVADISDCEEMFSIQPEENRKGSRRAVKDFGTRDSIRVHSDKRRKNDREKDDRRRQKDREWKVDKVSLDSKNKEKEKRLVDEREGKPKYLSKQHKSWNVESSRHLSRQPPLDSKLKTSSHATHIRERDREAIVKIAAKLENWHVNKETSSKSLVHGKSTVEKRERTTVVHEKKGESVTKRMRVTANDAVEKSGEEIDISAVDEHETPDLSENVDNPMLSREEDEEIETESSPSDTNDEDAGMRPKYSKFDSSPEEVVQDIPDLSMEMDTENLSSDDDNDTLTNDSDINGEDLLLTEEELNALPPDFRVRVEELQQKLVISMLPEYFPGVSGCRNVAEFECLNRIEEGTFGVVYRAKEKRTDEIVALKRLKMEKEKEGFPITSLREINMLIKAGNHPNIVNVREVVVGSNMDKIYLVMDYVEHDMKTLMDSLHGRQKNFTIGQVKTLMSQLLSGVAHLHDEWILHRDLKTSNLLLSHQGILKIGDFGLAREFGDPLKAYTPVVVTLWYRAPELLLGVKEYSTAVDMWSCGCIFAEFLKLKPLFAGKGEVDQIHKIFLELGTPTEEIWSGYHKLPGVSKLKFDYAYNQLWKKFPTNVLDKTGLDFMNALLRYDPKRRLSAHEALKNKWFQIDPLPTPPNMFPTWPARSELSGKSASNARSPITKPPCDTKGKCDKTDKTYNAMGAVKRDSSSFGFALRFDPPRFSR